MIAFPSPVHYTLRPSKQDDFEFIFQLNKTNMRHYVEALRGWDDEAEREDMRRQFQPGADSIILIEGKEAGILGVDHYPSCIDLRHIEILPAYQRRGIGTAIIRDLLAEAERSQLPVTLIVLQINPAKRLYERLGFRTVEEVNTGSKGIKCHMTTALL
ncbi:MAG: hypothetical protein ETSY1_23575 [Candidatus Entotheonella factor]|uniref:N-acetyltransferase domain-containing protein n=1 Tax=Entotheonella factor TaxID=1429438 RepID=W4LH17_ENTF1|nr:GNAT family N-acetyltransferase [Candidatus Entotheonella palauensis]ETW97209.1 MAG: hypothetical protein ETSY1_23575 [Candidatus Entotheonella factor]